MPALTNTAYNDYSQNPNDKYTYVRIIEGNGVGGSPLDSHETAIKGGLNNDKYVVSINGDVWNEKLNLADLYKKLLNGEIL